MMIDPKEWAGHSGGTWEAIGRGIFADGKQVGLASHPRDVEDAPGGGRLFPATYEESLANAKLMAAAIEIEAERVRLEGENERLRKIIEKRDTTIVDLLSAAGKLILALKPFASVAEHDISVSEDDADCFQPMSHNRTQHLTVGDLRRARAVLGPTS